MIAENYEDRRTKPVCYKCQKSIGLKGYLDARFCEIQRTQRVPGRKNKITALTGSIRSSQLHVRVLRDTQRMLWVKGL